MNKNLNYGIIGNCKSAALISDTASIDWCCLPNFNSPSIFAKLLDKEKGGSFEIMVSEEYKITQEYIKNTNILTTKFSNGKDIFVLYDFMPRMQLKEDSYYCPPDLIRYFKLISGKPSFKINYQPRLMYGQENTVTNIENDYIKSHTTNGVYDSLYLYTDIEHQSIISQSEIQLDCNKFILISHNQKLLAQTQELQNLHLSKTKTYWLDWSYSAISFSKYQTEITRSALTLKLLSYEKTGAFLAAATTSLPEAIGEERNWDYRFCWIRDASMAIKVMAKLGHFHSVKRFMNFIIDVLPMKDGDMQIMYGINKETILTEKELPHLSGYENSSPVRIGNAAYHQKQHDIYGILMDVIHQQFELFDNTIEGGEALWSIVRGIVRTVKRHWKNPDKGIWEIRNEEKHFTFSKVLAWVAIDRAIKIAQIIHKISYIKEWQPLADEIKQDIHQKAWNEKVQSFTQFYGSKDQDASNLLIAHYGFIDSKDEKYIKTVQAIEKELCVDGLMFRYKNKDDFGLPTSSFTICTFWLINSLHAIGETKKAKSLFNQILTYSNHLGLFSEDIDFKSKRLLGNFPQAYSHLALIETAISLSQGEITEDEQVMEALSKSVN